MAKAPVTPKRSEATASPKRQESVAASKRPEPSPAPKRTEPPVAPKKQEATTTGTKQLDPSLLAKRLEEIEKVQQSIKSLGEEYKKDFPNPHPLGATVEQDLKHAMDSLDLLKIAYRPPK